VRAADNATESMKNIKPWPLNLESNF